MSDKKKIILVLRKTKKCSNVKCTLGDTEQLLSEFKSIAGNRDVAYCLTCRTKAIESKNKRPEAIQRYNQSKREGTDYKEDRKKDGIVMDKIASHKRNDNQTIDGVVHAWCSGNHKCYVPATNFNLCKDRHNGLRAVCKTCIKDDKDSRKAVNKKTENTNVSV
ncbi:MAG: hypothetical protein WD512_11395 [Candidatus Paceibacterota bacterium]